MSRNLVFGWVHKDPDDLHFKQILKPLGGLVTLDLDCENDSYSASELKKEVIAKFKTPKTESIFSQLCSIEIGLHDGQVIKDFATQDGEVCDLWEFLSIYNFSSKTHLYLVTMEKATAFEHIGLTSDKLVVNVNNSLSEQVPKTKVVESGVQTESLIKGNSTTLQDGNDSLPKSSDDSMNQNSSIDVTLSADRNNIASASFGCEESLPTKEKKKNDYPQVQVLYRRITKSEYSGHLGITSLSKADLYDLLFHSDDGITVSLDEFDPYDYGYSISEITVSGTELLHINTDPETLKRSFHFPDIKTLAPHKIAYDINQVQSFIGDEFGMGFVPTCTDDCKPVITFYKNDEIFKKGKFRYWIYIKAEDLGKWKFGCKSECNCIHQNTNSSEKTSVTVGIVGYSEESMENLKTSIVPVLLKSEFSIGKEILGAGAQGTVKVGQYLGTEIAVKSINVINDAIMEDIKNEISVMESIIHPNIIQILGICCEKKKVHILMESFKNVSLFDLIFDEDAKLMYDLTVERKNSIAKQMCLAVAYLHGQNPPIIHRDIKTANIMVNKHGVVKIGDFGLSKIYKPASTTVRGTTLYMAPENYVDKKPATVKSDIWSLGCALFELYSEEVFGSDSGIKNDLELLQLLKNGYKPKLESLPKCLKDIVNQCFALNPTDRPLVSDILKAIEKK